MDELIRVENLTKTYRVGGSLVKALDNVSLSIQKGEMVAIIGQSGSGKSTLMNILGCLDIPSSGNYFLAGKNMRLYPAKKQEKIRSHTIGFIFQSFHLISSLTALENVELPLLYRGMGKQERRFRALASLKKVGLENRVFHRPSELSGGQQQRVAIARAIAASPPLIFADEPTGNLDSQSGKEVMQLLNNLHNEGHTIVLITHDADIAEKTQRKICICDGRIKK